MTKTHTKNSLPWRRLAYPVLISMDFGDIILSFFSAFNDQFEKVYQILEKVFSYPNTSKCGLKKNIGCASFF